MRGRPRPGSRDDADRAKPGEDLPASGRLPTVETRGGGPVAWSCDLRPGRDYPSRGFGGRDVQMWIGLPDTAIAASLMASLWVGWAWQV